MQRRMHHLFDDRTKSPDIPPKSPLIRPHLDTPYGVSRTKKRALLFQSNTVRIWVLIMGIAVVYGIHRLFHSTSNTNHSFYNQEALYPVNYLNTSTPSFPPFSFCPVHGPGDAIGNKYGAHAIARSRLHLGSGARIHRLLHKVS